MFSTLTAHYSDEALAKLITEAKRAPQTLRAATGIESMLLDRWMTKGKRLDTIYARLKLNVDEDNVLKNPLLGLARVITTAQKGVSSSSIALSLKDAQLRHWHSNGLKPNDVFSRLRLNIGSGDELLRNPNLDLWVSYVSKFRKEKPYKLLLLELGRRYNEIGLARVITTAQKDVRTSFIASNLKQAQLKHWQSNGLKPNDLLSRLRLNVGSGDELLRNPNLDIWVSYVKKLGEADPYNLLLLMLKSRFDDEGFARVITTAQRDDSTSSIAGHLMKAQLQSWQSSQFTPEKLFSRLRLNVVSGDELVKNPKLNMWVSYADELKKKPVVLLFSQLKTRFTDDVATRLLVAAWNENKRLIPRRKVDELLQKQWHSKGKTADDIFKLLQLNRNEGDLFVNPMLSSWSFYLRSLVDDDSYKLMLSMLRKHYDDATLKKMIDQAKASDNEGAYKDIALKLEAEMRGYRAAKMSEAWRDRRYSFGWLRC
ncbi:hypothetical protein GN958_ATG01170 [Phytophthora infestans]|uniref:RxLR effector protein n=1 Tax=Phytophthora infestans TaxID=4787 RepID=A0A8S9VE61_PHYIN|nr:hypothetical protein GN958_ATG01170 [Phytophthora infestans]